MRNLKKFLALVLAMVMALSLMVTASAASDNVTYPDGDSVTSEFQEAVTVLGGMGVMTGDSGSFYPDRTIMRSEMAAVLYRLMTGDTSNLKNQLYADIAASRFTDVSEDAWFAPYVGWCYDAGIMVGSNGYFRPWDNVTGYETLVMTLRAMGYGKNGEYTGIGWNVNASSDGTRVGLLRDVNNTHYANTLSQYTRREVVASIVFQAAQLPTVTWTPSLGYNQYKGVALAQGDNELNPSLGMISFGLTPQNGIVVGNQATGEDYTLLGVTATPVWDSAFKGVNLTQSVSYVYGTDTSTTVAATTQSLDVTLEFNFGTGLDYFGHKVTAWYDCRTSLGNQQVGDGTNDKFAPAGYNRTYAVIDKAVHVANVYAEDAVLSVGSPNGTNDLLALAAANAGFVVQPDTGKPNSSQAHFSDRYSQMGASAANGTANVSPVSMYTLVSNNDNMTVDVAIALSAEVARVTQKNTTAADPYLVLGSNAANQSTFGNGTQSVLLLGNLTPDTQEAQKNVNALVTAYQIVGTSFTLTTAAAVDADGTDAIMYQLDPMKTVTKTVATYVGTATALDSVDPHVTEVNFTDGTSMKLSGITRGDDTNSEIISGALPVVGSLSANTSYTVYEDIVGRFISMVPASDYKFLYGTYADFLVGGLGTGTIDYNLVGVNWDGEIEGENALKSVDGTPISGSNYTDLDVTRLDYGDSATDPGADRGNQIMTGIDIGYMYNATTGDLDTTPVGTQLADGANWTISATDAANGFKRVNNSSDGSSGTDFLLTNSTKFIIVTGTGTATLKVEIAQGLTGLLAGGTSADITKVATGSPITGDMNQVIFRTDAERYGTVNTGNNGVITTMILSDANLTRFNTQTLFFNFDETTATGMVLPGANSAVMQFELWNGGSVGYYFVDTRVSTKADGTLMSAASGSEVEAETFYTLAKIDEVNGTPVYKAVALSNATNLSYAEGFNAGVTYKYITVTNLETGLFEKGSGELVFDITKATVCDVDWAKTAGESATRSEITNVLELNNAVSVKNVNPATPVYGIEVAVVYDGVGMVTIYVTDVTT